MNRASRSSRATEHLGSVPVYVQLPIRRYERGPRLADSAPHRIASRLRAGRDRS